MILKYALLALYFALALSYLPRNRWEALYWAACFTSMAAITFGRIGQ